MTKLRPESRPAARPGPSDAAKPPVPVPQLPDRLRAYARAIDDGFGNGDGALDPAELDAFARQYGTLVEHREPIATLRRLVEPTAPAGVATAESLRLARALVRAGGSGTGADVQAVVAEIARIPAPVLRAAERAGITVVACRGSVTDHLRQLRGQTPRGWPPGVTWDTVPGLYWPQAHEVVVATSAGAGGGRRVPPPGSGHGASSLAFHELLHGLDYEHALGSYGATDPAFRDAWRSDRAALDPYLAQPEPAGPEEAFAELAADALLGDPQVAARTPHLARYFEGLKQALGVVP